MHIHTSIYTYIFHSMWTSQTSTRYVWEAEPGVPDEYLSTQDIHCSIQQNASYCSDIHCHIAIHLISGLRLSRLRSRSSIYTRQNFSIQIKNGI